MGREPTEERYRPVACGLHDRFEDAAVRRRPVTVRWGGEGGEHTLTDVIADIVTVDGAEWLVMREGERIRLDWIHAFQEDPA